MNREAVYEQLKIDEGVVYEIYNDHLEEAIPRLDVVTLSQRTTLNSEGQQELQLRKKELRSVSKTTLTLPSENVTLYTKEGHLTTYQTKSSRSWLI